MATKNTPSVLVKINGIAGWVTRDLGLVWGIDPRPDTGSHRYRYIKMMGITGWQSFKPNTGSPGSQ